MSSRRRHVSGSSSEEDADDPDAVDEEETEHAAENDDGWGGQIHHPQPGDHQWNRQDHPAFKRPRLSPGENLRRESQTSTASSLSCSDTGEETDLDKDAASLNQAIDSTSSSDNEEEQVAEQQVTMGVNRNGAAMFGAKKSEPQAANLARPGNYSSAAERMMAKMGYQSGAGLGKAAQGRVEPVGISSQKGRRGLGLVLKGLETDQTIEWNSDDETIEVEEVVSWLPHHSLPIPPLQELRNWREEGARKEDISDEIGYCDPEALASVLDAKTVFDKLEPDELMKSRSRSNPFETIRSAFFLNRAAMKMANIDAICEFMFTNPVSDNGISLVVPGEPLYFADVCSGPGGFSEYILWRKKWKAKGFGFTLKNAGHDFKLEDFYAGPPESFEPHYGVGGVDGDGNVFCPDNISEFRRFVLDNTGGRGVHIMMADGGFCVEGQENLQEILSKQLYLCQCIVALSILRPGGHFVCKLFDIFTPFSVGLVYLMYRSFQAVSIHKPNTSRPANSERYVICKWKRPDCGDIHDYLFETNQRLSALGFNLLGATRSHTDVLRLVPDKVMLESNPEFLDYIRTSNNSLADNQVVGLTKIAAFCRNETLHEFRQGEFRVQCLDFWNIPDESRKKPILENPRDGARRLLGEQLGILGDGEVVLTGAHSLGEHFRSLYDWRAVVLGVGREGALTERTFILGLGRSRVYMLEQANMFWKRVDDQLRFELSPNTLIYAEVVKEFRGEGKSQRRVVAVQVIDGIMLGGEDISSMHFMERHAQLRLFLHTMNKNSRSDYIKLRLKTVYKLEDLQPVYDKCDLKMVKGGGGSHRLVYELGEPEADGLARYFQPTGVMFYRTVREPYMMALSKSAQRKYWFNTVTKQSVFELPLDSVARFVEAHRCRVVWYWEGGAGVHSDLPEGGGGVTRGEVERFVESRR
eukprot:TRINITY_DN27259_c0_g1_i1.p1 TRINITY_DN27259_c0_g1~~TRINITY_DN27259_c0_g1_i1.p1  ORF type:complete len:923 (-),score=365.91 TRINITY_DN27259_c0_g1_i1:140-2908(-)